MQLVVDGVKANYLDLNPNQKKTLVILHGWGSSLNFWLPISQLLSPDIRLILVDLPGFGLTPPVDDSPDIPEYTHFVRSFTQKLKLKSFILAGHSFGGQITLDYALKFPADLRSIILIAPAAIREKSKIVRFKVQLARVIRPWLSDTNHHIDLEQYLGWYTPRDYANSNDYQRRVLQKIVVYNLKPFLSQVTVPTDIIWGTADIIIPNTGRYLARRIPHSHLHLIAGANHLVHLTHAQQLADLLNRIIKLS